MVGRAIDRLILIYESDFKLTRIISTRKCQSSVFDKMMEGMQNLANTADYVKAEDQSV